MGTSSDVDLVPLEIMELILARCPAKSVVRFKSVSKSWLSIIISHPRFPTTHRIQRSKLLLGNHNKFLVWAKNTSNGQRSIYLMRMEDGKFQRESVVMPPCQSLSPLCYCDGLFLLRVSNHDHDYVLWNPSIRKRHTIILSNPSGSINPRSWHHIYHDATTDDYKILFRYPEYCYKIYSTNNESWGEMKQFPPDVHARSTAVFIDGCLYIAEDNEIVCFDVRDGKLHKFPQPNDDVECCVTDLMEVSGRLCLYGFNRVVQNLEMWVMENNNGRFDKCWRKLLCVHKLEKVKEFYEYSSIWPLCLGNEDDVVFRVSLSSTGSGMSPNIMYNPRDKSIQEVDFTWEWSVWCPYSENLYMPPSSNIVIC